MPKRPSAYYRPDTLAETLRLLRQPDHFALGGGTQLLAGDAPAAVVDLQDLGLNQIEWLVEKEQQWLQVGAMARLAELADFLTAASDAAGPRELLRQTIRRAGPNTIRNAATTGGTVAARQTDSELLAVWLLLEAQLTFYPAGATAPQTMALADYLQPEERPSGLITALQLPWQPGHGRAERVARTPADTPIVSVTLWQPAGQAPRLAATGLDQRPFRLTAAEALLTRGDDDQDLEPAAAAVRAASRHGGDFRGDAAYRAEMGAVLTRRLLQRPGG